MQEIRNVHELIEAFGGPNNFARWMGVGKSTPFVWLNRGYIPAKYADCIRDAVQLPVSGEVFNMWESK